MGKKRFCCATDGYPDNRNLLEARKTQRLQRVLISLMVAAGCFAVSILFHSLYPSDDNYYISFVVNGLFDDVGECQYLHPLLGRFLHALSLLLPGADTFMLVGRLLVFLEIFWLTDLLLREKRDPRLTAAILLLLLLASLELDLFNCNYTIQAASFAAAGLISLSRAQRQEGARMEGVVGALFFAAGFMWRRQGALLAAPYILLETAANILPAADRRRTLKRCCRMLLPCLVLTAALTLSDAVISSDVAHREARAYDDSRIKISDYPTLPWKRVEDRANGELTEADYYASQWWILFDTEKMNTELFRKISQIGSRRAFPFTLRGAWGAAANARTIVLQDREILRTGILLAVLAAAGLLALPRWQRAEILLICVGTLAILLYFIMLGRAPRHLWQSVLFIPIGHTLCIMAQYAEPTEKRPRVLAGMILLCILLGLFTAMPRLKRIEPQFALNARRNVDESAYSALVESDAFYVWHKLDTRGLGVITRQGKLPSKELLNHLVSTGDWTYGQIYFKTYLERLGMPNPAAALLERDDVFLVSHDPVLLFAILEERAGGPIEAEQVGTVLDTPIYSISVKP